MAIIGIICFVIAIVLFFIRVAQEKKLTQILLTETSTAKQLLEIASEVGSTLSKKGTYAQFVEVKGIGSSKNPLEGPFSKTPCIYYTTQVIRNYEEIIYENDSEGKSHSRIQTGSEVIQHDERSIDFTLDDGTGVFTVLPNGANLETVRTFSQFKNQSLTGSNFSVGGVTINLGGISQVKGRTTGYLFEENSIPVNRSLYILGQVDDKDGVLTIRKSATKGEKFIISIKSEEELISQNKKTLVALMIGSIVFCIGGVFLVIGSFFG